MSLRPIKAERLIKILAKVGFKPIRQRGSHVFLRRDDGRVTVVPVHKGEKDRKGPTFKNPEGYGYDKGRVPKTPTRVLNPLLMLRLSRTSPKTKFDVPTSFIRAFPLF